MKIDPATFIGATSVIVTLLLAILGALVSQIRWQSRTEGRLDSSERRHDHTEKRVENIEAEQGKHGTRITILESKH